MAACHLLPGPNYPLFSLIKDTGERRGREVEAKGASEKETPLMNFSFFFLPASPLPPSSLIYRVATGHWQRSTQTSIHSFPGGGGWGLTDLKRGGRALQQSRENTALRATMFCSIVRKRGGGRGVGKKWRYGRTRISGITLAPDKMIRTHSLVA